MSNYWKAIISTISIFLISLIFMPLIYPWIGIFIADDIIIAFIALIALLGLSIFFHLENTDKLKEINVKIEELNSKVKEMKNS